MDYRGHLARQHLDTLIEALSARGYRVIGPSVRDGAIHYRDITAARQLPAGYRDEQAPGHYHLERTDSPRMFDWANGPEALKPYLFPARETLWEATRAPSGGLRFTETTPDGQPLAMIGVRPCDIAALQLLDRHFLDDVPDPNYARRREGLCVIAVHCTRPAETCFCASTGDGPRALKGFDLALSELDDGYLVEVGSPLGEDLSATLPLSPPSPAWIREAEWAIDAATLAQRRRLPTGDLPGRLFSQLEHPHWDELAKRCLACGNCTSVCPSCFCHRSAETTPLGGEQSRHEREWDSCFTRGHSQLHGYVVRPEIRHRYRQWLTHKLGSWHQQYGRSGCVGCGRCITWCPVGIDLTEEVAALSGRTAPGADA